MVRFYTLLSRLSIVCLGSLAAVEAATYSITENIVGNQFYNSFDWQTFQDPTRGRVQYVDQWTSQNRNLTYASGNSFVLRTDYQTVLNPGGPGRQSVRIRTKRTYRTHVAVFDLRHMPEGCATWPAIWATKEDGWPNGGEIDIVEGVHGQAPNAAALHTTPGCSMPSDQVRGQTGTSAQLDCNYQVNNNQGCNVKFREQDSFGPNFNRNGGGWFAMERHQSYIKVWFWPRYGNVPSEVRDGTARVNPDSWGTPAAHYPNNQCQLDRFFAEHHIIINLTLCGDWAGAVYPSSCPSNCIDHVNYNPGAFREAYFDFAAVRIYQ